MLNLDALKEKIRYYTEWIRLLWAGMFLLGAGVISFLLALDSHLKILLFVLGMFLQVVFAVIIGMIHRRVSASIKALEGFK
ncbi:MAG TPA: hypothetical protein VGL70_01235 [Candidatus Binatia bacterium]